MPFHDAHDDGMAVIVHWLRDAYDRVSLLQHLELSLCRQGRGIEPGNMLKVQQVFPLPFHMLKSRPAFAVELYGQRHAALSYGRDDHGFLADADDATERMYGFPPDERRYGEYVVPVIF